MTTRERHTPTIPTSAVRNTRVRSGPQGLEEPTSDESREGGMEVSTPEARHQLPVSSEDSDETNLLHLGPGRGRRVVYSIGWWEKNKAHPHLLTAATRVPTQRELRCNQGSIITGAHRPEETTDIQRVKTAREVTGNPNQRGTGQTPTKMISISLGRVRKETLSHLGSGILISKEQGCLAMSRHMTEAGIRKTT
ncbi:hypothetical protein Tco_0770037 [Tanacetum coccineum]|uniref:Uncharacterized protein n=1 Tax=Tanacetum coccineum TaxID=301880 RepID=A0ABQ4ZCY7_9ASTR